VNVIELNNVDPPPATAAPFPSVAELMEVSGGVVSTTDTMKLALPVFGLVSAAVQVTVVVPIGKVAPEAGPHVGPLTTPTASVAVAFA